MTISRDEALAALHQVEKAEARSMDARVYRTSGLQLIGWGVVWIVGYGLEGVRPQWAGITWPLLVLAGVVFCFLVVRRRAGQDRAVGWRWAAVSIAIVLFFGGTYALFPGAPQASTDTFPALVLAVAYAAVGGWRFTRFLWIGAALFALTLAGFAYLRPVIDFWLAAVGGGALVLGGSWLTRA